MMDINVDFLQWFIWLVSSSRAIKGESILNKELVVEELHKPIIEKFEKRRINSPLTENIWGTDLDNMQLISNFDKGIRFLLCVTDIFSKYHRLFFWKIKKVLQ